MRINISIDDNLLKGLDDYCTKYCFNRSELISKIVRDIVFTPYTPFTQKVNNEYTQNTQNNQETQVEAVYEDKPNIGWCKINRTHPFIKGEKFEIRKFTWEDENGNPVIKEQYGCLDCIKFYENMGRGKVYYL